MEVYVRKEIHAFEYVSFTEFKPETRQEFCCEKLQNYTINMESWSTKIGKFSIVEKNSLITIEYCPFCGEKIEYIKIE